MSDESPEAVDWVPPGQSTGRDMPDGEPRGFLAGCLVSTLYLMLVGITGLCCTGPSLLLLIAANLAALTHSFTHYLLARWAGIPVRTISLGIGPAVPRAWFRRGRTTWQLGLIPLGAFIRLGPELGVSRMRRVAVHGGALLVSGVLGIGCLLIVGYQGEKSGVGVVGMIEPGAPAWSAGMRSGDVLWRIGDVENPTFDQMRAQVTLSAPGAIPISFGPPDGPRTDTTITPRFDSDAPYPMIGLVPAQRAELFNIRKPGQAVVMAGSAASAARPPFQGGDEIVGTTDPDRPAEVTPLPADQHNPSSNRRDFFAFQERLQRLAGQEMTIRVQRPDGTADIVVPPAYRWTLGVRWRMGRVVAVRGAAAEVVRPQDVIVGVAVATADGKGRQWIDRREVQGQPTDLDLDPMRLPWTLAQWAEKRGPNESVRLTLLRPGPMGDEELQTVEIPWDDRYRFAVEFPLNMNAPVSIAGLGIAYYVEPTVQGVAPESPATRGALANGDAFALQPGDAILDAHFYETDPDGKPTRLAAQELALTDHSAGYLDWRLHSGAARRVQLTLSRPGDGKQFVATFDVAEDQTWPATERGMYLTMDWRLDAAAGPVEAIGVALQRLATFVYRQIRIVYAALAGRFQHKTVGGPVAVYSDGQSAIVMEWLLYLFLAMMGFTHLVLALVNLLPIPGCDAFAVVRAVVGSVASATNEAGRFA